MARRRNPFQQRARSVTLPPPVGGWNARDALASMPPTDAVALDNFTPGSTDVALRNGFTSHATGLGTYVESLIEYSPPDNSGNKLFAAVPTAIYDVTSAGAVGAAAVTSLTNGRWQHTMMATAGGNFLVICNGADSVRNYNGSAWSTPTITGVTSSTLVNVCNHQNRLWFCAVNSLKAWYLAGASIAGTATEFDIGPLCRLGGHLVAMGTITRDGGSGMDDMLAMVTSKGEVIIYSGTDPNDAEAWFLQGVYKIAEPVGRRCMVRVGADLAVITSNGLISLSSVIPISSSGQGQQAASDKIGPAFRAAYQEGGTAFGWQVIEYPKKGLSIVNVPVLERTTQRQFVMNTATGAWSRWTGINAGCWSLLGGQMYFGGNDGTVYQVTEGYDDDGDEIPALLIPAFNRFGTPNRKHFKEARVLAYGPSDFSPALAMAVDYNTSGINYSYPSASVTNGSLWDVAEWDTAEWGAATVPLSSWQSVAGLGVAGTVAISLSLDEPYTVNGVDVLFEQGGLL